MEDAKRIERMKTIYGVVASLFVFALLVLGALVMLVGLGLMGHGAPGEGN